MSLDRKRFSPTRSMARWGSLLLLIAMTAVLLFLLLTQIVPSLHAYRRIATLLIHATLGVYGLALGGHEWRRWQGKVVAIASALLLVAFFLPQMPGRLYVLTGCTVVILAFLLFGFGKRGPSEEKEG